MPDQAFMLDNVVGPVFNGIERITLLEWHEAGDCIAKCILFYIQNEFGVDGKSAIAFVRILDISWVELTNRQHRKHSDFI